MDLSTITRDGIAIKDGDVVRVFIRWTDDPNLLKNPSITCLNPEASDEDKVYERVFRNREIFLANQRDAAIQLHLRGGVRPITVIGANGLSSIKDHQLKSWHIRDDSYRVGTEVLLETNYHKIRKELGDAMNVRFVHGCSSAGTWCCLICLVPFLPRAVRRPMVQTMRSRMRSRH